MNLYIYIYVYGLYINTHNICIYIYIYTCSRRGRWVPMERVSHGIISFKGVKATLMLWDDIIKCIYIYIYTHIV